MDGSSFDTLARLTATGAPRRGLLRSALALLVAGLGFTALLGEESEAAKSCQKRCKQKAKKKDWSRKKKKACLERCQKQDQNTSDNPALQACTAAAECGNDTDGSMCACRENSANQKICTKIDGRFLATGTCADCQDGEQCIPVVSGGVECILPCRA